MQRLARCATRERTADRRVLEQQGGGRCRYDGRLPAAPQQPRISGSLGRAARGRGGAGPRPDLQREYVGRQGARYKVRQPDLQMAAVLQRHRPLQCGHPVCGRRAAARQDVYRQGLRSVYRRGEVGAGALLFLPGPHLPGRALYHRTLSERPAGVPDSEERRHGYSENRRCRPPRMCAADSGGLRSRFVGEQGTGYGVGALCPRRRHLPLARGVRRGDRHV